MTEGLLFVKATAPFCFSYAERKQAISWNDNVVTWRRPEDSKRHSSPSRHRHRIARQNFDVYEAIIRRPFGELNGDMATSRIENRLDTIEIPVFIIQGECDRVLPEGHVDWLVRQLPQARKRVLKGGGA